MCESTSHSSQERDSEKLFLSETVYGVACCGLAGAVLRRKLLGGETSACDFSPEAFVRRA
jgi:hypothetical protein